MPPKSRFTREEVISAALACVRVGGAASLTARALAARLGCSVKPIFGLFANMEEVQRETMHAAKRLYHDRTVREVASGAYPAYKATGMAYIRFALEERELFRWLYMRDRTGEEPEEESIDGLVELISRSAGISAESARLFHLEMWVYVHGIASMIATGYLPWDLELASRSVTDCYMGLISRFHREEKDNGCDQNSGAV